MSVIGSKFYKDFILPYSLCFYQNLAYSRCSDVSWMHKCHIFQIRNNDYFDVVFSFSFYPLFATDLSGCNSHFLLDIAYKEKYYWILLRPFFFLPFFLPFLPSSSAVSFQVFIILVYNSTWSGKSLCNLSVSFLDHTMSSLHAKTYVLTSVF